MAETTCLGNSVCQYGINARLAIPSGVCCYAMRNFRLGLPLLCLLFSLTIEAQQPFRAGLSGADVYGCDFLPLGDEKVEWISPDRVENPTDVKQIASDGNDRVLALLNGPGLTIVRMQPSGSQTPFYQNPAAFAETFAVGSDGRVYVPLQIGPSFFLAVISPDGVLQVMHPFPIDSHPTSTAIAHDGCTFFFYTHLSNTVRRFNACTGAFLPDVFPGHVVSDIEPLPNGQVLLAEHTSARLYDANGTFIRTVATTSTYGFNEEIGQVAVTDDGQDLWLTISGCGVTGYLLRVSFNSGTELSRRQIALNSPNALVIGNAATSDVPLGPNALMLLAIALAAVAVLRL